MEFLFAVSFHLKQFILVVVVDAVDAAAAFVVGIAIVVQVVAAGAFHWK